jgi:hypothetical protein
LLALEALKTSFDMRAVGQAQGGPVQDLDLGEGLVVPTVEMVAAGITAAPFPHDEEEALALERQPFARAGWVGRFEPAFVHLHQRGGMAEGHQEAGIDHADLTGSGPASRGDSIAPDRPVPAGAPRHRRLLQQAHRPILPASLIMCSRSSSAVPAAGRSIPAVMGS